MIDTDAAAAPAPLRLLYVSHSFPPEDEPLANLGGMQRVAPELYAALAARADVAVVPRVLRASWAATPYLVGPFLARLLATLPAVVRRERIDAVLFSSVVTATLAVPLRRRLRARGAVLAAITLGLDVTTPNPLWQRLVRRTLGALDLVFPISRATAAECLVRGAAAARVRVVPCGVDLTRFTPPADRAAARRDLLAALGPAGADLPPDALLLASVGRHVRRKGFAWFIDAVMPRLSADVVYLLAGEGPETAVIREMVTRRGLGARVRLLGRAREETLDRLYRGADLFIMPNIPVPGDIEGFGVVMLEAGLAGLWTIAAGIEGIRDAVTDGENGDLVPAGDAEAFARAILQRHQRPELRADRGTRARSWVEARFGWAAVAAQIVAALRAASTGTSSGHSPCGLP